MSKRNQNGGWGGGLVVILLVIGGVIWLGYALNASGLERNVRACLEDNNRYSGDFHHIYMTEVLSAERTRSFPDGTATRRVQYLVENSGREHSTLCTW